jgi:hypothetical protein
MHPLTDPTVQTMVMMLQSQLDLGLFSIQVMPSAVDVCERARNDCLALQDQASAEIASIKERYQAAVEKVLVLAEKDLQELRTYNSPPIEAVLAAVCVILGFPSDWKSIITLLNDADVPIFSRIAAFDLASMHSTRVTQLARLASAPDLHPDRVRTVSAAAHSLALWVHAVNDHTKANSIRLWERGKLQEVLQKQAIEHVRRHSLHCISTCLMLFVA